MKMKLSEERLFNKIKKLEKERDNFAQAKNNKIIGLRQSLRQICTHSKKVKRDENYEGGYLNKAECHKIIDCALCGKELDRKIIIGSYS